jgi:hypothetical protein
MCCKLDFDGIFFWVSRVLLGLLWFAITYFALE